MGKDRCEGGRLGRLEGSKARRLEGSNESIISKSRMQTV